MNFAEHSNLKGLHAMFSPSQASWLRYDDEKLIEVYTNKQAAKKGTELHEYAAMAIKHGRKQPRTKETVNSYVNDAIGFKMKPEVVLFYSENFFGTADAISFRNNKLRIHDLKTGKTPASMDQLLVYAALFCLEYRMKPGEIEMELRIYQNDEVFVEFPTAEDILPIMDHIIHLDNIVQKLKEEDES